MQIEDGTALNTITIQGLDLNVPAPFTAGHVLRENEAAVLNQTLAENLRNNFASQVKAARAALALSLGLTLDSDPTKGDGDKLTDEQLASLAESQQADLDKYVTEYDFGVRRTGAGSAIKVPSDPVEREAYNMAKEQVRKAVKAKGIPLKNVTAEQLDQLAKQLVAQVPALMEQARTIVQARQVVAGGNSVFDLGSLNLGSAVNPGAGSEGEQPSA